MLRAIILAVSLCFLASDGAPLSLSWAALQGGRPFAIVTYLLVHGSLLHLLVNWISFGNLAPGMTIRYGGVRAALVFFATGAMGGLCALFMQPLLGIPVTYIVGCSGALCGWMGYALIDLMREKQGKTIGWFLVSIVLFSFAYPQASLVHLFGFLSGLFISSAQPK